MLQNRQLDLFLDLVVLHRYGADNEVERFTLYELPGFLISLCLLCKMRKQVGNNKNRLIILETYRDIDLFIVLRNNDAGEGKRDVQPLIFLHSTVVVGFKQCYLRILKKRYLFQIKSRCIRMGNDKVDPLLYRFRAHLDENNILVPVHRVEKIALFDLVSFMNRPISPLLCFRNYPRDGQSLAFR